MLNNTRNQKDMEAASNKLRSLSRSCQTYTLAAHSVLLAVLIVSLVYQHILIKALQNDITRCHSLDQGLHSINKEDVRAASHKQLLVPVSDPAVTSGSVRSVQDDILDGNDDRDESVIDQSSIPSGGRILHRAPRDVDTDPQINCQRNNACSIQALHMFANRMHVMNGLDNNHYQSYLLGENVLVNAGTINKNDGFRPSRGPLKIWDHERWPNSRYEYFADISRLDSDGKVSITRDGLYLLYAQITFQTAALHQSASIFKEANNRTSVITSCIMSERFETRSYGPDDSSSLYLLCPMTTAYYLHAGSKLFIESTYYGRRIMLSKYLTTWGIILLNGR